MKDLDVEELEILATLDSHTSSICRHMDRKRVRVVDAKPGVTVPPFHCYCRSTTIPYIPGLEGTRTGRNQNNKSTDFDGEITYEEWEKNISISSGNAAFYCHFSIVGRKLTRP